MSLATHFTIPLPYFSDSAALFNGIAQHPWAVFLDSGFPYANQGRYDILAAEPVCTLVTNGDTTQIEQSGRSTLEQGDSFEILKAQLAANKWQGSDHHLPFQGGAIGYFAYDLARGIEKMPNLAKNEEHIPDMAIGIYDWALVVDHQLEKTYLTGNCSEQKRQHWAEYFSQIPMSVNTAPFQVTSKITANLDKVDYIKAFNRIKQYLKEGDCYQVNLSQRFAAQCQGDPWHAYQNLRKFNAAPFGAYLNLPGVQILSSSPERFLKLSAGRVETKPIKGTRPRKTDPIQDQLQQQQLIESPKDRSENLMIVDLLRNDLGKTCQKGSVSVPHLFAIESYATVHHLVSTVTGTLAEGQQAIDLLKSCFPGGSITGAPKIRAMQIIEELEPSRRGVYCGAIGYISQDGSMDTNIAIRTLVHSAGNIRFWAGGGIVNDSSAEDEYQECFDKAAAMLALLKQLSIV